MIDSINALKDIYNRNLNGANIRIVSISGYIHTLSSEFNVIREKLKSQGCYVIDSPTFGSMFTCINQRNVDGMPQYYYSKWQEKNLDAFKIKIAIPFTGLAPLYGTDSEYQKCGDVSYSWVIPRLSGILALCLQLKPDITLEEASQLIFETKIVTEDGIKIINPKGMLERLSLELKENKKL